MGERILFSAIGGTDPIRNCRDGAMLHICRKYKPDMVYLYLSKEMCERHEKDNRYLYCLEQLGKKLNHEFKVCLFMKEDLVDVQLFDTFLGEFKEIINEVRRKHEDAEILLNVSSGTPGMKSALQILSVVSEIPMTSIQVSTPVRKINPPEKEEDDYELYWEINEDNEDEYEDRCVETEGVNLLDVVKRDTITKQIRNCNYVVALELAQTLAHPLNEKTVHLIKAAKSRLELDYNVSLQYLKETNIDLFPVKEEEKRKIFEYVLSLEVKIRKGEYADFVRAISPAIVDLFKVAMTSYAKLDYKDFVRETKNGEKWDLEKLNNNTRLISCMNNRFGGEFMGGYIYAAHFLPIFEEYCTNKKIIEIATQLRIIEKNVRNIAAHNICSVTGQWLKAKVGYTPQEIYKLLQDFINLLNFKIKKEDWNSYDTMNEIIIREIQEQ